MKIPALSGSEERQNDHVTDAHQLVTKTKEGAVMTKGIHPNHQVIWSLFIPNEMLYIAISRKVIKSLKHGDEPFRHAGGASETPVCGGEICVCICMGSSTPTKQLKEDFVGYLYTLWQAACFRSGKADSCWCGS